VNTRAYNLKIMINKTDKSADNLSTKKKGSQCQWLTPVILAAQEAEVRRITVQTW
jgi:hypothetical protein